MNQHHLLVLGDHRQLENVGHLSGLLDARCVITQIHEFQSHDAAHHPDTTLLSNL